MSRVCEGEKGEATEERTENDVERERERERKADKVRADKGADDGRATEKGRRSEKDKGSPGCHRLCAAARSTYMCT